MNNNFYTKYLTLSSIFMLIAGFTMLQLNSTYHPGNPGEAEDTEISIDSGKRAELSNTLITLTLPNPYRSTGTWGKLPEGRTWGAVIGVFPDSKGNIWVMERCGRNTCLGTDVNPIIQFDAEGNYVKSFGGGLFAWPHGFFIDHEDNIWATDASGDWIPDSQPWKDVDTGKGHTVMKFSADGELMMVLGQPGVPGNDNHHFNMPSDVVVSHDGYIFVADGHQLRGNSRIVKFKPDGEYMLEWGEMGTDLGQFRDPHAIAIDSQGRVFVGDRMNNRIQIFDQEGNLLAVWTQFGRPSGIFFMDDDMMYVADSESNSVRNPGWERGIRIGSARDGWVRYFIPDPVPNPDQVGTSGAEYIAADAEGNVYAAEVGPRNLNKYIRLWPQTH
jgi:hypothetical protein